MLFRSGKQQFSQDLLLQTVKKLGRLHCADLFDAILDEIQQFAASQEFADDVCLVGVEVDEKF